MRPLHEAIVVYLVSLFFPPIVYAMFSVTLSFEFLRSHAYIFGTLLEFFLVGFLCILFALLNHDSGKTYGLTSKGLIKSLMLGVALIALHAVIKYASGNAIIDPKLDAFTQSLAQPLPYNIGFTLFAAFAYGPLEVFYIIFLVVRFDQALSNTSSTIMSKGTIITTLLWALPHILNTLILSPIAAMMQVVRLIVTGLVLIAVFKHTGCSAGSMLYWTFANLTG